MTGYLHGWLTHDVTVGGRAWPLALVVVVACIFGAIFLAGALVISAVRPDGRARRLADRVERYGAGRVAERTGSGLARAADRLVSPALRHGGIGLRLAMRLDLAGIGVSPAQWVLAGTAGSVALVLMLAGLLGSVPIGVVAGALGGWLGMRFGLNLLIARRRARFADQLPDLLQFIAGSLRSGFSLGQGLEAAVREGTQPVASEFDRALEDSRLGADLEDALDQVAARMESIDLEWAVMAIRIQRETGGNLAEVLSHTVETMRERSRLRRHVRSLSAEGRLSAYVLVALPIFVGGYLFLTRRSYLRPLYTTTVGIVMLGFAVLLIVVGSLWMSRLVKVEV
jgi:Flp pilus assembly protein TadB